MHVSDSNLCGSAGSKATPNYNISKDMLHSMLAVFLLIRETFIVLIRVGVDLIVLVNFGFILFICLLFICFYWEAKGFLPYIPLYPCRSFAIALFCRF